MCKYSRQAHTSRTCIDTDTHTHVQKKNHDRIRLKLGVRNVLHSYVRIFYLRDLSVRLANRRWCSVTRAIKRLSRKPEVMGSSPDSCNIDLGLSLADQATVCSSTVQRWAYTVSSGLQEGVSIGLAIETTDGGLPHRPLDTRATVTAGNKHGLTLLTRVLTDRPIFFFL